MSIWWTNKQTNSPRMPLWRPMKIWKYWKGEGNNGRSKEAVVLCKTIRIHTHTKANQTIKSITMHTQTHVEPSSHTPECEWGQYLRQSFQVIILCLYKTHLDKHECNRNNFYCHSMVVRWCVFARRLLTDWIILSISIASSKWNRIQTFGVQTDFFRV